MLGAFGPHGCHTLHHFHDFQCLPGGHPFFGVSCGAVGRCFAFTSREKKGFPGGASGIKSLPANAGDLRNADLIPGLGRSPGGGHGNPLQHSCLEKSMDRGSWWATVHRVTKSRTRLKRLSMHAPKKRGDLVEMPKKCVMCGVLLSLAGPEGWNLTHA